MKLVCLNDFIVDSVGGKYNFKRGSKYTFKVDNVEYLCDEIQMININGVLITTDTLKENFVDLSEWRDEQLDKLINLI